MRLTPIKERIADYIHHLTLYDYIAYGWLLAVMVGFLLLAISLAGKKPKTALWMILVVLILMIAGPFGMKYGLDQTVRRVVLTESNVTQLHFARDLIVTVAIRNDGRIDLSGCRLFVRILRRDPDRYKEMLYSLKPLRVKTLHLEKGLKKGSDMSYRVVLSHFDYPEHLYRVDQRVECY
jgi:predicted ABC-type exoprotein transport system permease subunit